MSVSAHTLKSCVKRAPGLKFILGLAAIFLLVTLLEAGHAHGLFTEAQDDCALCHHALSVEKTLIAALVFWILFSLGEKRTSWLRNQYFAEFSPLFHSRAPPQL